MAGMRKSAFMAIRAFMALESSSSVRDHRGAIRRLSDRDVLPYNQPHGGLQ
jgi:hypothetical protein